MNFTGIHKAKRIIENVNKLLNLDLKGQIVLTEVGSNYFVYTPIIAHMANAKKVYAWTRDSKYGKASEVIDMCMEICKVYGLNSNIEFAVNERPMEQVKSSDIITNLGYIRPLDRNFLSHIKKDAVIPLMCEAWELRGSDIDIAYCRERKIPVAGTWENAPELKIFDACGSLAIKMANEANCEVYQNNIILWSDDHFGEVIGSSFKNYGAKKVIQTTDTNILYENSGISDFIFLCDYEEKRPIFSDGGIIDIEKLCKINPDITIIHLHGDVDNEYIKRHKLSVYPDKKGYPSIMTYTLAHLGMTPIINLHAAGLKVGELLKKNKENPLIQKIV
jgi:hypothetical protein